MSRVKVGAVSDFAHTTPRPARLQSAEPSRQSASGLAWGLAKLLCPFGGDPDA